MNKNQKTFFITVFAMFCIAIAFLFNTQGFFDEISKAQAMLFAVFIAICAIPIYYWTKSNDALIQRIFEDDK